MPTTITKNIKGYDVSLTQIGCEINWPDHANLTEDEIIDFVNVNFDAIEAEFEAKKPVDYWPDFPYFEKGGAK